MSSETWEIIRNGVATNISSSALLWTLQATNIGAPPKRNISVRGPQQHGHTITDFRYDARSMALIFGFEADSLADADARRDIIYNLLKGVTRVPVSIRVTRNDGQVKQVDGEITGIVDPAKNDTRLLTLQRLAATLECGDPFWYDPTARAESYQTSGTGYQIPLEVPWEGTEAGISDSRVIAYSGSWDAYPIITITGPITDPVITNETLDLSLDFTGYTISDGDNYTIDLRYGRKTVKDAAGVNQIAKLTTGSDLATWRLSADPSAPAGLNTVRVTGTSGNESTRVALQWFDRYVGL